MSLLPPPSTNTSCMSASGIVVPPPSALPGSLKTEVAYIIIMNVFGLGVTRSSECAGISMPTAAMLLVPDLHEEFSRLGCYFGEIVEGGGVCVQVVKVLLGSMGV